MRLNVKVVAGICIIIIMVLSDTSTFAQTGPPPPPPAGGHGQSTNLPPQGGTAPVGNGIAFLVSMGIGYGIAIISKKKKLNAEKKENL